MARWLPESGALREKLLASCERSGVRFRSSILPLGDILRQRGFTERNRMYNAAMVELGTSAVARALAAGPHGPERFHTLITVSCTGVAIPPPDVHIMSRLGFSPHVRRIPVTELGCVAGAVALSRGAEAVDAHPRSSTVCGPLRGADLAIVLAAEFCSLSFQPADASPGQAISNALFGDAVVALILGPESEASNLGWPAPRVVATRSHVAPDTADLLGFDLRSSGFHIVLSAEVPHLVRRILRGLVEEFLEDLGWSLSDISRWVIHPGGEKVLQAVLDVFGLGDSEGAASRDVLGEWGNASSAAVLLVLEKAARRAEPGDRGLLISFGPGFSTEVIALEW
ncbi:MAG TPA: 3-oxoacyl-[acyl-carrier-protein] synthase III C-terminal domain-containing protein [Planctomycetota bacterium]|nr:3-oxoacyl-[acyl-carrier-protein] synthase III C-terminal domain-containing protein [Planctomycetota bacterium]